jgi:hypothetical protein
MPQQKTQRRDVNTEFISMTLKENGQLAKGSGHLNKVVSKLFFPEKWKTCTYSEINYLYVSA